MLGAVLDVALVDDGVELDETAGLDIVEPPEDEPDSEDAAALNVDDGRPLLKLSPELDTTDDVGEDSDKVGERELVGEGAGLEMTEELDDAPEAGAEDD